MADKPSQQLNHEYCFSVLCLLTSTHDTALKCNLFGQANACFGAATVLLEGQASGVEDIKTVEKHTEALP